MDRTICVSVAIALFLLAIGGITVCYRIDNLEQRVNNILANDDLVRYVDGEYREKYNFAQMLNLTKYTNREKSTTLNETGEPIDLLIKTYYR